jgi:hypothetical protein
MGFLWDIIQQGQISNVSRDQSDMMTRVARLEDEMVRTNRALMQLVQALEKRFGEDLDGDGRVGR